MAKNKSDEAASPKEKPAKKPRPEPGPWPLPYWARLGLSVWLAWHVFVVFMAPLSLQPKNSELTRVTAQSPFVRWYTDPLYLNGGYSFFSPDPPMAGQLVRYRVLGESGEPIAEGEFPNRANSNHATQWPRLWYHRHMMLADQAGDLRVFGPPPNATYDDVRRTQQQNLELNLRSYARHLLRTHGGQAVELQYIEHRSLNPEEFRPRVLADGTVQPPPDISATDPSLYRTVLTLTERAGQLEQPLLPPRFYNQSSPAEPESLPLGGGA
ncbi:hypothetical protein Pla123a_20730 [Posidoniimonas polymericola]|uniref:Uncharacterized protein n=1 Tax=Posidoniimonas polymericola TaxID=2528002 RepID=A0A5C5YR42_9BACT|nr:hypothetical protein [Posidoniimonas polymericola]TWT77412.1 hypothetical protein Pla123a_20730 [Posidoniimonas polymericola]